MICLYVESNLCTFTFIFYTCIWIPFSQITHSILRIFTYLFNPHQLPEPDHFNEAPCELDLPVMLFQDLNIRSKNGEEVMDDEEEEMCTICLMEFEKGDLVNKLPRCGHLFHAECMEKWLDRCRFTCPICRSSVLHVPSSPCKLWSSSGFCMLYHDHDS